MKEPLAKALGDLIIAFSRLEAACAYGIAEFFPESEYKKAELLAFELSFKKRLDVLLSLAKHVETETESFEALKKAVAAAANIEERRNEIVHSHWEATYKVSGGVATEGVRRVRIHTRRKGTKSVSEPPKVTEIINLAKHADATAGDLLDAAEEASYNVVGEFG